MDLKDLEKEKTHDLNLTLEDGAGSVNILLTVSATFGADSPTDLANYTPNPKEREAVAERYVSFTKLPGSS